MEQVTYQANPLSPKEHPKITELLQGAPLYETLMVRAAAANLDAFQGWWHGAYSGGELHAVAAVESNIANIWGDSDGAVRALGESMARATGQRPSTGGTHQLVGEERVIDVFWDRFQKVRRTLVGDRRRGLISTKTAPATKSVYSAEPAVAKEVPIVAELLAEQTLEQWGVDPRRSNKAAHEAHCAEAVETGRILLGRQKGRPVFVCERQEFADGLVMLSRAHVSRPSRRARVIAGVLAHALTHFLKDADEVVMFADKDREEWTEACQALGLETAVIYRFLALR